MLLLFPSGRLEGRATRIVAILSVVTTVYLMVILLLTGQHPPGLGALMDQVPSPIPKQELAGFSDPINALLPLILCSVASIAILLRRLVGAHGIVRQQIKWVVYAMLVVVAANIGDLVVRGFGWPLTWLTGPALSISVAVVPVAIGIAILRFHLFDIDRVISRTLVYGSLSLGLAVIYLLSVLSLQRLLDPLTSGSDLAVAATTLLVAALARPLRNRVQRTVDRRFYRRHYDATREIDRFASRLREQTDLDALAQEIRGVVQETMQPSHVSLWLTGRGSGA
jgi:hypothetical protein